MTYQSKARLRTELEAAKLARREQERYDQSRVDEARLELRGTILAVESYLKLNPELAASYTTDDGWGVEMIDVAQFLEDVRSKHSEVMRSKTAEDRNARLTGKTKGETHG